MLNLASKVTGDWGYFASIRSPFQEAVGAFALKLMHYNLRDPIFHWHVISLTLLQNTSIEYALILNIKFAQA